MWTNLSFDGFGVNDRDDHRSRLATFANDSAAKEYGDLFAAAPDLLTALQALVRNASIVDDHTLSVTPEELAAARTAISRAKGGAEMGASINIDDIPVETRRKLGLKKQRTRQFSNDQVRTAAIRVLGVVADIKQDQRRRVLEHALKLNRV